MYAAYSGADAFKASPEQCDFVKQAQRLYRRQGYVYLTSLDRERFGQRLY